VLTLLCKESNYSIAAVIIEKPLLSFSRTSSAQTIAKLNAFTGAVSYLMFTLVGKDPEFINASTARKKVCGKLDRSRAKELAFAFVKLREPEINWPVKVKGKNKGSYKKECMDMADSYIVGRAYFND